MLTRSDHLALTRTALANERTLLAYVRTALALSAGGVGLLEFTTRPRLVLLGGLLLPAGLGLFALGLHRFRRARQTLQALAPPEVPAPEGPPAT